MAKRYFHTFDALRFFAFLKVFLLHIPITYSPTFNFFRNGGDIGVIFFFVLSGFLITYIILDEKNQTGQFNLKNFFIRRILRIWPLYYLMVLVAFITPYLLSVFNLSYSDEGYEPDWLMSLCFLENYKIIATNSHPNVSPLSVMWSLCIEEHFYIIWGISLFLSPVKKVPAVIITSIFISLISNIIFFHLGIMNSEILTNLWYFAFGAIPAYLLVTKKEQLESYIQHKSLMIKYIFLIITLTYVMISPYCDFLYKPIIEPIIFGILFAGIICVILPQNNSIKIEDRNILSKLGKYTYGLYLYHTLFINLFIQLIHKIGFTIKDGVVATIFVLTSLLATILVSQLSYFLFEKPFLSLKKRFD